jgi:hypothetical protein
MPRRLMVWDVLVMVLNRAVQSHSTCRQLRAFQETNDFFHMCQNSSLAPDIEAVVLPSMHDRNPKGPEAVSNYLFCQT